MFVSHVARFVCVFTTRCINTIDFSWTYISEPLNTHLTIDTTIRPRKTNALLAEMSVWKTCLLAQTNTIENQNMLVPCVKVKGRKISDNSTDLLVERRFVNSARVAYTEHAEHRLLIKSESMSSWRPCGPCQDGMGD